MIPCDRPVWMGEADVRAGDAAFARRTYSSSSLLRSAVRFHCPVMPYVLSTQKDKKINAPNAPSFSTDAPPQKDGMSLHRKHPKQRTPPDRDKRMTENKS